MDLYIKKNGVILVVALWVLMFLSVLGMIASGIVRGEIVLEKRTEESRLLYDIGSSGIANAISFMKTNVEKELSPESDSLNDVWVDNKVFFKKRRCGEGSFNVQFYYVDNMTGKSRECSGFLDEDRNLNINTVSSTVLYRLLNKVAGIDPSRSVRLAAAIVDWRDADDIVGEGKDAFSESITYGMGGGNAPKNSDFKAVEELLLVKGMDPEVFVKIRDYVTVFGSGRVNINTASRSVLLSLGLSDQLVEKVILYRAGNDRLEGTPDDNLFSATQNIINSVNAYTALTNSEKAELLAIIVQRNVDVKSGVFKAVCISELPDRNVRGETICIFDRNWDVKYWGFRYIIQ
ncbi:MAG TPA: type II secretion system protein GspK [Candidatus Omnitrophota bacterium]|nr:type II secretion system protein GspK [Candidatus Omnitrophota bacterium]